MIREQARLVWKLLRADRDLFGQVDFDQELFDRIMSRPSPDRRYAIFFTPRSGSSRLTDLFDASGALNRPGEFFNPGFLPNIAQAHSARTLGEYVSLVQRRHQKNGVYGCEITYAHILRTFRTGRRFLKAFRPDTTIWLMREDIVAQAVSVSRMMQTKVTHSVAASDAALDDAEDRFQYRPGSIRAALVRLSWMESRTEALIRRARLAPFRLSYEMTNALEPGEVVRLLADHIGAPFSPETDLTEKHRKLPGSKGVEFARRFREEHRDLMRGLEVRRRPMLEALVKQKASLGLAGSSNGPD